jgi:hypothetical protein
VRRCESSLENESEIFLIPNLRMRVSPAIQFHPDLGPT